MLDSKTPSSSLAATLSRALFALPMALLLWPQPALAGGTPATGTTADQLLTVTGSSSQTEDGDFVSARSASGSPGLNTHHRFFIEVPATASRLKVDLFDMDLLMGAGDRVGERDRDRAYPAFDPDDLGTYGNEIFMSAAVYQLFDPDGNAVVTKRRKGSRWAPGGGDNAWLTFYDSATATPDPTNTWRDEFTTAGSYAGSNGTQSFSTNWIESNETGINSAAGAGSGLLSVTGGVLRITNVGDIFPYTGRQPGIERELNLSGYTSATMSFSFSVPSINEKDDIVIVEASADGGATWTVIDDITGGIHGVAHSSTRNYDITDFIASNTRIRFRVGYLLAGGSVATSERIEIDNFEIRATANAAAAPRSGHWEVRVDVSRAVTQGTGVHNGDETNAYGIRASDGDPTSGGQEFNVYSHLNTSGLDDNDSSRSYTLYPLLTSGCDFDAANFDWDANLAANTAPDPDLNPPFGTFELTGRETTFTHTLTDLSDNNVWYSENVTNFTDRDDATNYGIWTSELRIDDPGDGNYVPHYYTDYDAATITPPTSAVPTDSLRIYFPTDAGGAPAKPYLKQFLSFKNVQPFGAANPPLVGQTARYVVYVQLVNPSGSIGAINFNASRTVTTRFPGGLLTYQGVALTSQGSIVSEPTLGSNVAGDIVWNPGSFAAGSAGIDNVILLAYEIDFTPTSSPYTVDFVGAPGSGNGTRATWLDETGYDTVGSRSIFSTGELCQLWVQHDVPTPVLISSFRGWRQKGRSILEWQTAAEAKTISFDLYRGTGKSRVKVNPEPLTALLSSPQGGTYRLLDDDAPAGATQYWLEAHDSDGQSTTYGPFEVRAEEELSDDLKGDYSIAVHPASQRHLDYVPPARGTTPPTSRGEVPTVVIETTERGLYRVGRAQLQNLFALSAAQVDQLLVGGRFDLERAGERVAWIAAPGLAGLDFVAPGFENAFTGTDVFRLRIAPGQQMKKVEGKALPTEWSNISFRDQIRAEQNLRPVVLLPLDPEGDIFFWDFVRHGTAAENRSFPFTLHSPLGATATTARLFLDLQGGEAGSHQLELTLNGSPIGTALVAGKTASRATIDVDPALLLNGNNTLSLRATSGNLVFVDGFDLEYDRRYEAVADRLISRADGKNLLAAGSFTRPEIRVFDLQNPLQPRHLYTTRVLAEGSSYRVIWRPLGAGDHLAVAESGVRTPVAVRLDTPSQLRTATNGADYLVITTAALAAAAQDLAALREARGLTTQVVDIEDIYDEFAYGRRDPRALRDFLAFAREHWSPAPRYVVLAGHGTYDWRDHLGYHNNLIPSLLWNAGDSLYPSDALFADLEGEDGAPEVALGRLPVLTPAELSAYVAKLEAYEAQGTELWQSQVLMLSDQSGAGGPFLQDSRSLTPLLPAGFSPQEIALDLLDIGSARSNLFAALTSGAALVHYTGHGAVDRLSASALLTSADVPSLGNAGKPVVLSAVTCHVGFHALPTIDSLGEELLLHETGGAIAVFAPTWLSQNYDAYTLGDRLFRQLFAVQNPLLGDAVKGALAASAAQNLERDLLYAYQLLGDPALIFMAHPQPEEPGCVSNCGSG